MVYQGSSYNTATAYGVVINYNSDLDKLVLGATQGQFSLSGNVHAVSTNATATIESFDVNPIKLAEIKITPDPVTAQPDDDYGYTVDVTEWPETEL
jgi:hypothetical protein